MLDLKLTLGCIIFILYTIVSIFTRNFVYGRMLNMLKTQEYRKGEYSRGGGCVPLPVPEDAPFFVKDYSEYYKGRCYHKRSQY